MVDIYAVSQVRAKSPGLERLIELGLANGEIVAGTELWSGPGSRTYEAALGSYSHWSAFLGWLNNNFSVDVRALMDGSELQPIRATAASSLLGQLKTVRSHLDPDRDADWIPSVERLLEAASLAADDGLMFVA